MFVISSRCMSKVMWEFLQGQIKADSNDVGAASLCLCLGGQMWHFLWFCWDCTHAKKTHSHHVIFSVRRECQAPLFPRSNPDKQAAVTWITMGELWGLGVCGEELPLLQSSEEMRSPGEGFHGAFCCSAWHKLLNLCLGHPICLPHPI